MKKLLIFVAAVALTGASYFLLTKATDKPASTPTTLNAATNALEVEEFEAPQTEETAGTDYFENDYDRYDDPTSGMLEGQEAEQNQAQMQQINAADLEPIDDADAPAANIKGQEKSEASEPLTTARAK